ncbi:switch 2 [Wolffia australiana]
MSLKSFKETLNNTQSSSSSSSRSHQENFTPSVHPESSAPLRKPPKSSISQQLRRCTDSLDFPTNPLSPPLPLISHEAPAKEKPNFGVQEKKPSPNDEEEVDGELQDEGIAVSSRLGSSDFASGSVRGPFEPLVLSSPGEFPVVEVPPSINCRLLDHQRDGVKFLYGLYKKNHGGVLGDDMGLGKTVQTIAFLVAISGKGSENHGVHERSIGPVLVVCPTSVIRNWENEFQEWSDFHVAIYHGPNRDLVLEKLQSKGVEALVTSFDTLRIHGGILADIKWEIVVYDEAHRLKNEKSRLYKACLEIKTKRRFGLTGTIMQNKIMELFNLFDLLSPGSLGMREHFHEFYDEPLKHGQRVSAPERFVSIAEERRRQLSLVLRKYLLRRTKEETIGHLMLGKEDNVVFCAMSELQRRVYRRMLAQPEIDCLVHKDLSCTCGSPLTRAKCCFRIIPSGIIWSYLHKDKAEGCESCPFCVVLPCLMKLQQISNHLELIKPNPRDEIEKQKKDAELASVLFGPDVDLVSGSAQIESFMGLSDVDNCGKMKVLGKLLSTWISSGDKVLLFSYSVRMLDILEKFLIRKGYCFSRLDGSTPMSLRQSQVDDFNQSPSRQVFLISTRAGGLGLNLVSANRVVIFDPNWNPSQDLQAQDRSFRYGQKRHVVVFRLLAAGSVEELVYTRQVYKQQLSNIAVSGKMEKRYFEGVQDCKEFQGELFGICNLFRDLSDKLFTSEIIEPLRDSRKDAGSCCLEERSAEDEGNMGNKKGVEAESSSQRNLRPLYDMGVVYAHRNEDVVNAGLVKISEESKLEEAACVRQKPSSRINSEKANSVPHAPGEEYVSRQANRKEAGFNLKGLKKEGELDESQRKIDGCRREKLRNERSSKRDEFELMPIFRRETLDENLVGCMEEKTTRERKNKRIEYELIAAGRGMGVEEFSRWVLAASPSELQEVLLEHYEEKKRKKKRKGSTL